MTLTKDQSDFLAKHQLADADLFDASGLSRQDYQETMKRLGKIVAYGTAPCQNGHTLKTRAGHCPQCDPAKLGFMKRHAAKGLVYIAGTIKGRLVKIGFTKDKRLRLESLNRTEYGSFDDWVILCTADCDQGGKVEHEVSKLLEKYGVVLGYRHDSKVQITYELFSCSYETALAALKKVDNGGDIFTSIKEDKMRSPKYAFRNLVRRK